MRLFVIFILIISSIFLAIFSAITFLRRKVSGNSASFLSGCLLSLTIYSFGYALELSSNSLAQIMFWVRLEHFGIQTAAPFWFLFSLHQTGNGKWITKRRIALLFVIPVLVIMAAQTLGSLNLLHKNPKFTWIGPFPIFSYDSTALMILSIVYMSSLLIISTLLFTKLIVSTTRELRGQSLLIWASSFIPWISGLLYVFGLSPMHLDLAPFGCIATALILAIGLFKKNILTLVPLARDVIFDGMRDGVLVLNKLGMIIDYNRQIKNIFPNINNQSIGKKALDEFSENLTMQHLIKNVPMDQGDITILESENAEFYRVKKTELHDQNHHFVGQIITFYYYTEEKKLLDKLQLLAAHDNLTGVFNRRHFFWLVEQEITRCNRYGGSFSLMIFDLDSFKNVNDAYGHLAGDIVLKKVASTCLEELRTTDSVGRFGGEEFVILMPETDLEKGRQLAERLRSIIEDLTFEGLPDDVRITASFGLVSNFNHDSVSLERLLREADHALYQAKNTGRNRICVFEQADSSQ